MKALTKIVLLLWPALLFSQNSIHGIVLDSLSGKPVPYASIFVEGENTGTSAEENGSFSLASASGKTLVVSALGYGARRLKAEDSGKIALQPYAIALDNLVLGKAAKTQTEEIGHYAAHGFRYHPGETSSARLFEVKAESQQYPYLKEVTFYAMNEAKAAKMRLRLLGVNPDGSPGEDLIAENIIVSVRKGNRNIKVDLQAYNFSVPERFFVVLEKILIAANKIEKTITYKIGSESRTVTGAYYQPSFGYIPSPERAPWHYFQGKWHRGAKVYIDHPEKFENILMRKYHDKFLEPAVAITLSN